MTNGNGDNRGAINMKVSGKFGEWLKIGLILAAIMGSFFNLKAQVQVVETKIQGIDMRLDDSSNRLMRIEDRMLGNP